MNAYRAMAMAVVLSLSLAGQVSAGGNLVANGGFESGTFSDWTLSGNTAYTYVTSKEFGGMGSSSYVPESGSYYALLGSIGSMGYISETIATVAGQSYTFSWWLASDGALADDFSASWNGSTVFSQVDLASQTYRNYTFTEVATGPTTTISFGFRDDPGYLSLDGVSVQAVPTVAPASVPEPASIALAGIAGLTLFTRTFLSRRSRAKC